MAIYLDTNIVFPWRTFAELDRVALTIVSHQIKQLVLIPWVVAQEAEAHRDRALRAAVDRIDKAEQELNKEFAERFEVAAEPDPDVDAALALWRERLRQVGDELPLHPEDAIEAHRREAWRIAPAREGKHGGVGARDAAIWLTVLRDHLPRDEEGHYVTRDSDFRSDGEWKDQLADDLAGARHPLRSYASIEEFLELLGTATDAKVDIEELARRVPPSLRSVLSVTWDVPRAIFETVDFRYRYRTEVKEATAQRVLKARRYEDGAEGAITLVDSVWELVVDLLREACRRRSDTLARSRRRTRKRQRAAVLAWGRPS